MLIMKNLINQVRSIGNSELMPPYSKEDIQKYQKENNIELPESYRELISLFNGGEIFIPGTIIYGIDCENDVIKANQVIKKSMSIPEEYLIFGKYNFGDYLCIQMEKPECIIQWDHENNELFDQWSNLKFWLDELIKGYIVEINGEQNEQ
ncbi:SMI1/KNR4 family protein [Ruminococcus sp. zg-924]|uniref:SMI1/KNR4 family protein n=1 Tax=Ruminococcus sp. zg-924 TaxID=2678505 RepID=UPI00210D076C|nr:SMI1/KNR4 family protein [Ruminococcus sp. zg-924]MCQ4022826.1 hypothetical protein [Ruminococcus sp. zg-924]